MLLYTKEPLKTTLSSSEAFYIIRYFYLLSIIYYLLSIIYYLLSIIYYLNLLFIIYSLFFIIYYFLLLPSSLLPQTTSRVCSEK